MSDCKVPNDMSIEDILKSIRNVINNKSSYDYEEELELTEIAEIKSIETENKSSEENTLLSEDSAVGARTILENFVETARSLGHDISNHKIEDNHNKTMEAFLLDMLRPQMKEWLDANLQNIVKQVVADEIRRIVANISKKPN